MESKYNETSILVSEMTARNNQWMWKNVSCGKVIYVGDVQEPEKVNDTCMKTVHAGTMDRGFTVFITMFIRACHQTLSWARWIQFTHSNIFFKISFNNILPSVCTSLKWSLLYRFSNQNFVYISHITHVYSMRVTPLCYRLYSSILLQSSNYHIYLNILYAYRLLKYMW
jgi:hypothetical protein